jgi:uncharacterized membrane protein YfcA
MMLESFDLIPFLVCVAATGFAAVVHGAVGIGFPLIATPFLALFTDVRTAILTLVLPTLVLNVAALISSRPFSNRIGRFWPLGVYGIIGSFLGTQLLVVFPAQWFRPLLALLLIFYLNTQRIGPVFSWTGTRPQFAMALFGMAAGLAGGTVNVMLPVLVIFALELNLSKTDMIQVFNFCFFLGKLTQGAVFCTKGLFTGQILAQSILLSLWVLSVSLLSLRVRDRIDTATYRKWLKIVLAVMAGMLILQSVL